MLRRSSSLSVVVMAAVLGVVAVGASASQPLADPVLQSIRTLLAQPDSKIDLAEAKLAIDQQIDPTMDVAATRRQLNAWAAMIQSRFPPGASSRAKLDIMLSTLYTPGPWNENGPFSYDFDDPFGQDLHNKLISTYLQTRRGNCVSMPLLFVILGQKLGLRLTLATAPAHLLVKYASDDGHWLNVEATAGGFKYDTSYERETGISDKAIENQLYLRPLSRGESVAAILSELMEFYGRQDQQQRRIALADTALKVNPKDVVAMLQKADGDYVLIDERFKRRYPTPDQIPVDQRQEFGDLSRENTELFTRAEALGWTAPTPEQQQQYLESIKKAKATQGDTK